MSKFLYLMDPGHGGIIGGKYVTPGKRSPKFDDGSVLFEGVNNRELVNLILAALKTAGIDCQDIVSSQEDVSLSTRTKRANIAHALKPARYISIHSDGAGDGVTWHPASGMSIYTSFGQTESDNFASIIIEKLAAHFGDSVKWRIDTGDGDKDKEADFAVLRDTKCPSILCELGFHTNKEEATKMLTPEYKNKIVLAFVDAIKAYEAAQK